MKRRIALSAIAFAAFSVMIAKEFNPNPQIKYPTAPADGTVDTYFGHNVADPYRPLENDTAAATIKWVNEENEITRGYLDAIPFRNAIAKRLTELNNYTKTGLPSKKADGKYYFYRNEVLKNQ